GVQFVVLLTDVVGRNAGADRVRRRQDEGQINVLRLRSSEIISNFQKFSPANHLIDRPQTKLGHDCTELVRNVIEEVDDVFGSAQKLFPKNRVLRSDANGASVQMALAVKVSLRLIMSIASCNPYLSHHNTAHGNEGGRSKAPFFRT